MQEADEAAEVHFSVVSSGNHQATGEKITAQTAVSCNQRISMAASIQQSMGPLSINPVG